MIPEARTRRAGAEPEGDNKQSAPSGVRPPGAMGVRALVLGLLLIPPNSWWVTHMEKVRNGPYPTSISLFANAVFLLVVLIIANNFVRRVRAAWALSQAELMAVYTMVAIGSALSGHDFIPVLIQLMGHVAWFNTPSNQFVEMFGRFQPDWMAVKDMRALAGYYGGNSTLYSAVALRAWMIPVACWSACILAMCLVMMCLSILVRRQWVERERLTYPVVELPLQMTAPGGALWRNRLFWMGFALAAGIDLLNGLHYIWPNIPELIVKHQDMKPFIVNKPWNAVDWFPISYYPFAIGLGYLLPVDLLFSCWFFYLFWKGQMVLANAQGWDATPQFPFIREQGYGGYLAIIVILAWNGRRYIASVFRRAFGRETEPGDSEQGISDRACLLIIGAASVFLVWFFVRAGMSLWLALLAWFLYFAMSVAITRIRAELGPPVHDVHFSGPDNMLSQGIGTANLSGRDLTALNWFWWFNRAYRSHPMPVMAEGLKAAHNTRSAERRWVAFMLAAVLLGTLTAFWSFLDCAYRYGTAAKFYQGVGFGWENYNQLALRFTGPLPANVQANYAIAVGFAAALVLGILRNTFFGFPFHPIGYAISGSWSMNLVWMPMLIAWVLKSNILRFGGLRQYRFFLPFFLGLILGQCVAGSLWSLVGLVLGIQTYSFWGA